MLNRVPSGLAAMLGAGMLAGLAPTTWVAGTWMLAGLVLAAALAVACGLSTQDDVTPALPRAVGILGRIAGASAIAGAFGVYVVPAHPVPAAVGLIAAATVITALGWQPPVVIVRLAVGVILAIFVVFVAACFAIAPAGNDGVFLTLGGPGTDRLSNLPAATVVMFFCFLGFERAATRRARVVTIGVALVIYLAVAAAALYQLGGPRLALSATPLRQALAAADASGLDGLLTVGAALPAVLALLSLLADLRTVAGPVLTPVACVLAAVFTLLLSVPTAIATAAGLMLAHYALGAVLRRTAARLRVRRQ